MALTTQAASFYDILLSIRRRLVAGLELDETKVRLTASDQYRYDFEGTDIAIRPLGPNPFTDAGGGRRARPEKRTVRIYINKRSSLDEVGSDETVLSELIALENSVNDLLDDWWPRDEDDTLNLTIEPLHPTDATSGLPVRQPTDDVGMVFSVLAYEVVYLRPNNTPQP
jgi:hypothetical protein